MIKKKEIILVTITTLTIFIILNIFSLQEKKFPEIISYKNKKDIIKFLSYTKFSGDYKIKNETKLLKNKNGKIDLFLELKKKKKKKKKKKI